MCYISVCIDQVYSSGDKNIIAVIRVVRIVLADGSSVRRILGFIGLGFVVVLVTIRFLSMPLFSYSSSRYASHKSALPPTTSAESSSSSQTNNTSSSYSAFPSSY